MNKGIMVEEITNRMQIIADKYKETMFHEQDKWYENTGYYGNYVGYIRNSDVFSQKLLNEFKQQYIMNAIAFKDPFYQNVKKTFTLDIGYQIPEIYVEHLISYYRESFLRNNDIVDSDVEVSVMPIEYFVTSENIVKWGCFYNLEIELVNKLKKDKTKQK